MTVRGHCLCGGVRFALTPPIRSVIVCHCRQCAQWSGSAVAATAVAPENFRLENGESLIAWYASSTAAERGFCSRCGSSLFWRPADGSRLCVMAGLLDPPTGLKVSAHIFVASKSDYFEIGGDAQQFEESCGSVADLGG